MAFTLPRFIGRDLSWAEWLTRLETRRESQQRRLGGTVAAYVIYQGEVLDEARYDEYKVKAAECIIAAGGRYVVRGGNVEVLEGEAPAGRTVVLEFPTRRAAIDWYRGDEYTEIRKIRDGAATARMYVIDGVT